MKSYQFEVWGSTRAYWDFYFGFGFIISRRWLTRQLYWPQAARGVLVDREIRTIWYVVLEGRTWVPKPGVAIPTTPGHPESLQSCASSPSIVSSPESP